MAKQEIIGGKVKNKQYGWELKIMSLVGHSVVWPADYNWQRATEISPFIPQFTTTNASLLYPWFLSLWAMGTLSTISNGSEPTEKASFTEVIGWKQIDIQYSSLRDRAEAMKSRRFVPENNLPLGLHVHQDRIFISLPKWKEGVPVTLGYVRRDEGSSPTVKPYPNWSWHTSDCQGLISVFRMDIDTCGRLWVMDTGVTDAENTVTQSCPAQLVVFDLATDRLLWRYRIPDSQTLDSTLLTNLVVEVIDEDCDNAYAYIGDVFRYGIIVYSAKEQRSWRIVHAYFYPDPVASDYNLDGIRFQWVDGIFGMALSPPDTRGNRLLYFHPLSSYREFSVPTYILRNESLGFRMNDFYEIVGEPRGDSVSHSTGSGMDRNGVLFYNLLTKSGVGCWNWRKNYTQQNQGLLYQNVQTMSFPNDLRIDLAENQKVWILSNRLHRFLYDRLDPNDVNFRILMADANEIVRGTVCEDESLFNQV